MHGLQRLRRGLPLPRHRHAPARSGALKRTGRAAVHAAVGVGAALGTLLRWALGLLLDGCFPVRPPDTLAANLIGGYLVGVAVAVFASLPALPPAWPALTVTGFLGRLTSFSSLAAEVDAQVSAGQPAWAMATVAVHVLGSLLMTLLSMGTVAVLRRPPFARAMTCKVSRSPSSPRKAGSTGTNPCTQG